MNKGDPQVHGGLSYRGGDELIGGRVCLDFSNTVGARHSEQPRQYITSYQELLAWSLRAGLLREAELRRLNLLATRQPLQAETVLTRALVLREAIYRIFSAPYTGQAPTPTDLDALNRELAAAMSSTSLSWEHGHFQWNWPAPDTALDALLGPLARSAAELLTDELLLGQVRRCANLNCGWLFLDTSKNHSRRWCSMDDCGNRAKARKHYSRRRAAISTEG